MKVDLTTTICGIKFRNPIVLAAGVVGTTGQLLIRVAKNGAGGVTTKSISLEPRKGHPNPTALVLEHGVINAMGLPNSGAKMMVREIRTAKKLLPRGVPVIASVVADSVGEFGDVAEAISKAQPDFIEANISCPNVEYEFGKPFAADPTNASRVTQEIKRRTKIPLIVKLSPNVENIRTIAVAVEKAGADAVSAINTLGPGMVVDLESGEPILANKVGGISGPAIRPIAIRCVYDIAKVVRIPVIGIGGVSNGLDAAEMIMAGASAVGVGTAVLYRGLSVFEKITKEFKDFMKSHKYQRIEQFRGLAYAD